MKSRLLSEAVRVSARREWAVHSTLNHKNVIRLYEYTENENEISIFLEFANKSLYLEDLVLDHHTPIDDEDILKHFARQILEGLAYVHQNGIIHGDLKLENILVHQDEEDDEDFPTIKMWDFGFCHIGDPYKGGKVDLSEASGTFDSIAPEVRKGARVGPEIDVWGFGLILYQMAVAYKPTQIKNYSYSSGEIPFRKFDWRRRNPELKDLISKCMEYDPSKRISAEEALEHPWFSEAE